MNDTVHLLFMLAFTSLKPLESGLCRVFFIIYHVTFASLPVLVDVGTLSWYITEINTFLLS